MTGYIAAGSNPLSRMTVRSMIDFGYTVNAYASDAYSISSGGRRRRLRQNPTRKTKPHRMVHDSNTHHRNKTYPIIEVFP